MRRRLKRICFYAPVPRRLFQLWDWYQSDLEVLKELAERVDVCHSFWEFLRKFRKASLIYGSWWHLCLPAILVGRLAGIPTAITGAMHVFDPSGQRHFFKAGFLYRQAHALAFRLAGANLFISKDQLVSITSNFRVRNPFLVYSSLRKFQSIRSRFGKPRKARLARKAAPFPVTTFLTVAWLTQDQCARKGVWETLDAMRILRNRTQRPFRWILAGRKENAVPELKKRIKALGLQDVVLLKTNLSSQEKNRLYQISHLYVQPSWCEGLGYAVIEAISQGLPALVSRYSAQPEVVGPRGLIIKEINPEAICQELCSFLFLNKSDRERLAQDNMAHVTKTFAFDSHVESMHRVLDRLRFPPSWVINKNRFRRMQH